MAQASGHEMIEDFVTDLPDGAIPTPIMEGADHSARRVCDEVTLTVTFLVYNKQTDRLVVRFDLDSPYWVDEHEAANGTWSLALPRYEMLHLIATILQSKFMKVIVRREELLRG